MKTQYWTVLVYYWTFVTIRHIEAACEVANAEAERPRVTISQGVVEGLSCLSALNQPYHSFRGIPYATPPLGHLRFRAPLSPQPWTGVLQAVNEPPACLQPWRKVQFPITYNEDCLYLSVFTPFLKYNHTGKLMPVIVWIHGGKYFQGSGSTYSYGPDFLLSKDVVLVNINYRLGVFGYLNMDVPEAQGNAALKDTVAALKWIQKEIKCFGGDPNLVTIFGGSSGAGVVSLLNISPIARGLFSRAVSDSGSSLCAWSFLPSTSHLGFRLAHHLDCPDLTPQGIVSCLRAMDGTVLAEKQMILANLHGLDNPFLPSIESTLSEEVFLSASPQLLINNSPSVPYLTGIMNGEGLMFVKDPQEYPNQFTKLEDNFGAYLPAHMVENESPEVLSSILSTIKNFYLKGNSSLKDKMYGFVNYMSDRQFCYCTLKTAQITSTQAPVYLFYFTFEGEFQRKDHHFLRLNMSGVCHGEELGYLFYRNFTITAHNNISAYPRDMAMVNRMTNLWINFAKYGDPTPANDENLMWMPVKGNFTQHLIIGDVLEMAHSSLLQERIAFWNRLYSSLNMKFKSTAKKIMKSNENTFFLLGFVIFVNIIVLFSNLHKYRYSTFKSK